MKPAEDASGLTLEWTRPDLSPRFVYVWRSGQELEGKKHKFFEGRTSMFIDELTKGNISLKLSKVKLTDEGEYRCFIPALERQTYIQLVVGECIHIHCVFFLCKTFFKIFTFLQVQMLSPHRS